MRQRRVSAYLAPEGFVKQVIAELKAVQAVHGRLLIARGKPQICRWAQNIWLEPSTLRIRSIGDAAQKLRTIQRNWAVYSFRWHRRSTLIREKLPYVAGRPLRFPEQAPRAPLESCAMSPVTLKNSSTGFAVG